MEPRSGEYMMGPDTTLCISAAFSRGTRFMASSMLSIIRSKSGSNSSLPNPGKKDMENGLKPREKYGDNCKYILVCIYNQYLDSCGGKLSMILIIDSKYNGQNTTSFFSISSSRNHVGQNLPESTPSLYQLSHSFIFSPVS